MRHAILALAALAMAACGGKDEPAAKPNPAPKQAGQPTQAKTTAAPAAAEATVPPTAAKNHSAVIELARSGKLASKIDVEDVPPEVLAKLEKAGAAAPEVPQGAPDKAVIRLEKLHLRGPLKRDDIAADLRGHLAGLRECYQKQLTGGREPFAGTMSFGYMITPDGATRAFGFGKDSPGPPELKKCMAAQSQKWTYSGRGDRETVVQVDLGLAPPAEPKSK